jgi:signal transduction histidine kinase
MSLEVLLATAAGLVSLHAALFHGWVFLQHRAAREHLWVSVTAAGAAGVCFGTAHLYGTARPDVVVLAERVQLAGGATLTMGLLRFGLHRLRVQAPWLARSADVFAAFALTVDLLVPQMLIAVDQPPRQVSGPGFSFFRADYVPLIWVLMGIAFAYLVANLAFAVRALRRGEEGAVPLTLALVAWLVAALSDTAVGLGAYDAPYVLPTGGFPILVITLSAILIRDLVRGMDRSEALGVRLQELAREHADALRVVELQLARGEQLAAVGTLAAGVAHEINNPLAYVNANLNHLQQLFGDPSHDRGEVDEVLAECREGLSRVSAIAADLLRMARHGASESEELDLAGVIRSLLPMVEREAAGRVRIDASLHSPLLVHGSPRLLGQVALNLIWNAIHATGGRTEGEARIEVSTRAGRGGSELVVSDNGTGIPRDLIEHMFEPSFSTRPSGRGTGLGLALVQLIVRRHGGEVSAVSDAGGTCVTVWLPDPGAARAA